MVEAFVYMYFVGAGTTLGAASVVLLSYKVWQRMKNKTNKKRKGAF
ncbi:hypothetical protein IHV09_21910 [Fictibacillus sp. 23RED33]|nr:hypothetical protein [Fictibacillus sp. 23RED33]MBH0176215.1 hypothetical protein [Fictibacillus sp. 23RED33]